MLCLSPSLCFAFFINVKFLASNNAASCVDSGKHFLYRAHRHTVPYATAITQHKQNAQYLILRHTAWSYAVLLPSSPPLPSISTICTQPPFQCICRFAPRPKGKGGNFPVESMFLWGNLAQAIQINWLQLSPADGYHLGVDLF